MGLDQSSVRPNLYNEKKRENHPILGEITLVQDISTLHLFTKKCLKQTLNQIPKLLVSDSTNRNFLTIKEIVNQHEPVISCSSQSICSVIFQCAEVDLQSIQVSKFFTQFKEQDLLNIINCVLDGLMILNAHKLSAFPVSKKSIFMETTKDEYSGEDLSICRFKIVPLDFVRNQQIKQVTKSRFLPPELQNSFELFNQQAYLHYTLKSHIYCLGIMILDLIQAQQNKDLEFSFGHSTTRKSEMRSQTFGQEFSQQFMEMCRLMTLKEEEERIGMTCLSDRCRKLMKNKKKCVVIKDEAIFGRRNESRSSTRHKSRRAISSVGLNQRQSEKRETYQIRVKSKSKILNDLTNNVQSLSQKQKPNINLSSKSIIDSARSRKLLGRQDETKEPNLSKKRFSCIKFQNGACYEGELDSNNNFDGFGTLLYSEKQICYTGYWKNNNFHGFGYLFSNKQKYRNGLGNRNRQVNFRDMAEIEHKLYGDELWDHYEGEFKNDLKDGYGILFFMDGSKFEGQFITGQANGPGTFVRKNGDLINGLWKNHKLVKQYQ